MKFIYILNCVHLSLFLYLGKCLNEYEHLFLIIYFKAAFSRAFFPPGLQKCLLKIYWWIVQIPGCCKAGSFPHWSLFCCHAWRMGDWALQEYLEQTWPSEGSYCWGCWTRGHFCVWRQRKLDLQTGQVVSGLSMWPGHPGQTDERKCLGLVRDTMFGKLYLHLLHVHEWIKVISKHVIIFNRITEQNKHCFL